MLEVFGVESLRAYMLWILLERVAGSSGRAILLTAQADKSILVIAVHCILRSAKLKLKHL